MGSSSFGFRQQLWLQQRYLGRRDSIWGLLSRKRKGLAVDALHCLGLQKNFLTLHSFFKKIDHPTVLSCDVLSQEDYHQRFKGTVYPAPSPQCRHAAHKITDFETNLIEQVEQSFLHQVDIGKKRKAYCDHIFTYKHIYADTYNDYQVKNSGRYDLYVETSSIIL